MNHQDKKYADHNIYPSIYAVKVLEAMDFHGRALKVGDSLWINPDIPVLADRPSYKGLAVVATSIMF
jgi:hypothetical protein